MSGGQGLDPLDQSQRFRYRPGEEITAERFLAKASRDSIGSEQRAEFGGEHQTGRRSRIVKRLDSERVAREETRLFLGVPDRESEHAGEFLDATRAVPLIQAQDNFGVGPRMEGAAQSNELGAKSLVVVDFAVERD